LPWTHHLLILSQARPVETRDFYILATIKEHWSKRELERQIRSGAVLREALATKKVSPAVRQTHPTAIDQFKNAYNVEFLGLAPDHSEADLHDALLRNLGRFLTELGRDFCFIGSQYPLQVARGAPPPLRQGIRRQRRFRPTTSRCTSRDPRAVLGSAHPDRAALGSAEFVTRERLEDGVGKLAHHRAEQRPVSVLFVLTWERSLGARHEGVDLRQRCDVESVR
jgi:predicted nuclease of restriction endonuclease-like (RecB) superfamily